jgi:general L-amino acid transport system permease protein
MSIAREPDTTRIYTDEKPRRHAPVNERGILGWLHYNLFRTPLDAILTVVSAYVIYTVVASAVAWAVGDANWFAITRNLSLFMLGPLQADADAVANIQIMTLILSAAVGLSLAAWSRVGLRGWAVLMIIAAITVIAPRLIASTVPLPPSIMSAGTTGIVSGSLTETPAEEIAFIAQAGETVTLRLPQSEAAGDLALAEFAAFTDRAADAVVNAARNRVSALARLDEINALLAGTTLSEQQRATLEAELATLTTSTETAVSERYALNSAPVNVRLMSRDLETVLVSGTLTPDGEPLTVTLPDTGWYILQKSVEGESIGLIETTGIYPHFERQFNQPMRNADGEPLLNPNGSPRMQTALQFLRMTDDLLLTNMPPRREGVDVQRYSILDNQYRGERPLSDYLVLHLGPFLSALSRLLVPVLIALFVGYMAGQVLNSYVSPVLTSIYTRLKRQPVLQTAPDDGAASMPPRRRLVPRWVTDQWTWIATLSIVFLVIRFATPLGASLQTIGSGLVSLVLVAIAFISVNMLRPAPGIKYSRRVVSWLWFIMPFIIFGLVAGTDLGRWGGLFLTFMLTIVGIVASFPIGVLLALGRRADGLPAVKYACIAFIELVRGVPLITVLFLASLALPLVSPNLDTVPQAVRAMVAITLFSAAYLAENVRGGLQSIPPGQAEAARALGMNPVQVTVFITLPQALRAVIPALVGQCIALFKDTSLVAIVGLLDLTKSADSVVAQAEYIGLRREVYVFISVIYFVFSYAMGYVSRKIEQSGSGTARQTKL